MFIFSNFRFIQMFKYSVLQQSEKDKYYEINFKQISIR